MIFLIEIHTFTFNKLLLNVSSGQWRPFYLVLNVLMSDIGEMEKKAIFQLFYSNQQFTSSSTVCKHQDKVLLLWQFIEV